MSGSDLPRWMQGTDSKAPAATPRGPRTAEMPRAQKSAQTAGAKTAPARSAAVERAADAAQAVRKRSARTTPAETSPRAAARPSAEKPQSVSPPGVLFNCAGFFGIAVGLLFAFGCLAFLGGSLYLTRVLKEISKRNYAGQTERFEEYGQYFNGLTKLGFEVDEAKPGILQGKTTYSWSISLRNSTETRAFVWEHDLQANVITPTTNGALLMDIAHGFIKEPDAAQYKFYNPKDMLAQAIVKGDAKLVAQDLSGWADNPEAGGLQPPLAALCDPAHPKRKNGGLALPGEDPEQEEEATAAASAGNVAEGDATNVGAAGDGTGDAGGGGNGDDGSVEVGGGQDGGGEDDGGGEETPPDDGGNGDAGGETGDGQGDGGGEQDGGNGDDSTPVG